MKKITALVLALVMTLSLLPMNVWATDGTGEGGNEGGENDTPAVEETTEYKPLYFYDGSNYHESFTAYNISETYGFRLTTAESENAVVSINNGYENSNLSTEGNVGAFTCTDVDCKWSPASATDVEGYLRVEKDNAVYRLKVTVNNGRNVFTYQGVDIYTAYDNGTLGYGDGTYQDLSLDIHGGNGIYVKAPCAPNATNMSLYLKPADGHTLKITQDHAERGTLTPTSEGSGVYKLIVHQPGNNVAIEAYNEAVCVSSIEIMFSEQSGGNNGNNGDNRIVIECPISEYTKVVFEVDPDIAKVATFPTALNENRELVLTVNKVDDIELWRPLLDSESGFWFPYRLEPIVPDGVNGSPQIASNAIGDNLEEFVDYGTAADRIYRDSVVFAWASEPNENGVVTIMPRSEGREWAVRWKYGEYVTPTIDTVVVKSVLGPGVESVELGPRKTVPIGADRIALVDDYANKFANLDTVLSFAECVNGKFTYSQENPGVLTYRYKAVSSQMDPGEVIYTAAGKDAEVILDPEGGVMHYDLLEVTAPSGYVAKKLECPYFTQTTFGPHESTIPLRYHWDGFGTEQDYVITWKDANGTDRDIVEKLTIVVPKMEGLVPWMSFVSDGESPVRAAAVPAGRLDYTSLANVDGVAKHEYDEEVGVLFTTYDSSVQMDIAPVLDATFSIEKPADLNNGASVSSYQIFVGYDGTEDASYSKPRNKWKFESFWDIVFRREPLSLDSNGATIPESITGLIKQIYGEKNEIEYYYSANEGNRFVLIQWNYSDGSAKYEYMRLNTSSYFCQWEEELKADSEVTDAVEVPTAVNDSLANSNIKLVTDVHAQTSAEKFFFQLEMVEAGKGNVFTESDGKTYFTIILPYSFMGDDPDGNPWTYETARRMKEAKVLHYDKEFKQLKGNDGVLFGTFTERGIEFEVDCFSPFMLVWEDKEDSSNGYPGGYYPIVTPETTPVEKPTETKPTTPAQTTTPPAEVTVPVSGDEHTINVEVSVSGTTATIDKVDMTKLEGVIGDDVAVGTVTIDFSVLDKAIDTVEIPADVVKEIAAAVNDPNNDAKSLEVVLNDGMSIEFDAKALANKAAQADGLDITISMKHAKDSAINDHQKSAIGDRVAFDINVTSGGEHITDMGGEVIVHAPYVLRDGEEAAGIVVCYVDDAGNKEKCETNYDSVKQRVNWKTTHFSVYMIDYDATLVDDGAADAPPVVDDAPQSEATNDIGLWIGVALVVLVIAIVIVAVAIKRKK